MILHLVGGRGDVLPAVPTLGTNILAAEPTLRGSSIYALETNTKQNMKIQH